MSTCDCNFARFECLRNSLLVQPVGVGPGPKPGHICTRQSSIVLSAFHRIVPLSTSIEPSNIGRCFALSSSRITIMNSSGKEEEGHNLIAEAEKKLATKPSFFKSLILGGASAPREEAAETFVRAANCFKLAKAWNLAGNSFERAAEVYDGISELRYEAASKYADGGKAYKNSDSTKAVAAFEKAIQKYVDSARFMQSARYKKEVAEIYEGNQDSEAALQAYMEAADFYVIEDSKSNANTMRIKVATLSAATGKYAQAVQLYEEVAKISLASNMLKFGAREHLLRAGLCRLCLSDIIGTQRAVEKYGEADATFLSSREGKLLEAVVKAVDEGNVEDFTNQVYEYDSVSKLDEWKTAILLKIKNDIKNEEDDLT